MIYGLEPRLIEAGKIKIGKKGQTITSAQGNDFQPPVKMDHFEITTTVRDEKGNFIIDTGLMERIKKNGGMVDKNGNLIAIPIRFLYDDPDLNFRTELNSYKGKHLSCKGDGKTSFKRVSEFKQEHKCPCSRIDADYSKKDKCKYFGTLTCIIDEAELLGQAHKFRTTSRNTVMGILGGIELIKIATGGIIAGLPLMLTLTPKTTVTPGGHTTTVFIVSVCYRGSMAKLRADALAIAREQGQYRLSMNEIEEQAKRLEPPVSEQDQADVAEEFFPDTVEAEIISEKEITPEKNAPDVMEKEAGVKNAEHASQVMDLDASQIKGLPPQGQYKGIFDRLQQETDYEKAVKLLIRLQKDNIVYFLTACFENVEVDETLKKPELVALAKKVLKQTLPQTEEQDTLPPDPADPETGSDGVPSGQWDKQEIENGKENPEKKTYPRKWDTSGPVMPDQLRQVIALKSQAVKEGKMGASKEAWTKSVNYFLDADGTPIETAKQLTKNQGDSLIAILKDALNSNDGIPF